MASPDNKRPGGDSSSVDHHLSKRHCGPTNYMDAITDAKECIKQIFHYIETMLPKAESKFIEEMKERKRKLEEIEKEKFYVGVLGITGAGKSSLVNAVLGQKSLLPSGTIGACTSVIIELTANMENSNYEAEVEFIPKDEWNKELKDLCEIITHPGDSERQMVAMAKSKIQALYGDDAVGKDFNALTAMDIFSDIFADGKKIISHDDVEEFSKAIVLYISNKPRERKPTENRPKEKTHYWPLVKSITIKVPNAENLLENIVLVDVPGTGDWNKTRDKMWEQYISKLSSVWVVADITRAVSENAAWSILDKISDKLGPGGQCSSASFICTKTDNISSRYKEDEKLPVDGQFVGAEEGDKRKRACILDRNKEGKEDVEFYVRDQYKDLCSIKVFTVSSEEFLKTNQTSILNRDETEIPKLRDLLKELNYQQSKKAEERFVLEVFNFISTIHAINSKDIEKNEKQNSEIKSHFTSCLHQQLKGITEFLKEIQEEFNINLTEAAITSKDQCVYKAWNEVIDRKHCNTLKAMCRGEGFFRSKDGVITDMNATLIETMKNAIVRRFNQVFSKLENIVEDEKSVYRQIDQINIISENLRNELTIEHLVCISIKQKMVRDYLKKYILNKKKKIYHALSVRTSMQLAYEEAASVQGTGCMRKMQYILMQHIEKEKDIMFSLAKDSMLECLERLTEYIIKILHDELLTALMKPFETQKNLLPDVSEYYERMRRHHRQLTENV